MIQIKTFSGVIGEYKGQLDDQINDFLTNNNIKMIDIKLSAIGGGIMAFSLICCSCSGECVLPNSGTIDSNSSLELSFSMLASEST